MHVITCSTFPKNRKLIREKKNTRGGCTNARIFARGDINSLVLHNSTVTNTGKSRRKSGIHRVISCTPLSFLFRGRKIPEAAGCCCMFESVLPEKISKRFLRLLSLSRDLRERIFWPS